MTNLLWMFPGQGAQTVGMGKSLSDSSAAARAVFQRADEALGFAISKICFEGPEADLTLTANTQPAIVTVSIAALEAAREAFGSALETPSFAAGHSLGEYSALVAAGVVSLEDAVRLVNLRGRSMQAAVPAGQGSMAAVMGDVDAVRALCESCAEGEVLSPANFNAPGQTVISGSAAAVARAVAAAPDQKLKAIPLKVSAPFHCALMAPATTVMRDALASTAFSAPAFPVIANASAEPCSDPEQAKALLVRQVEAPVLWEQSMRWAAAAGVSHAVEFGPGKVLAGLLKRIEKSLTAVSVGDPESLQAAFGSKG